jgi:7-cyano-7-deazaguanine synthase
MWIDKSATWRLAAELGGAALVDLIVEETVTCYEGDRSHRHAWGYGCGQCPACELRAAGYSKYKGATANPERSEGPRGATKENSA